MEWYQYIGVFFNGAILANVVPHFVHGISGNKFPTPFAKPPGKGLSSPTVNVVWSLVNLVIGYLLFHADQINAAHPASLIIFLAGIAAMSIMLSVHFQAKDKE
ncbi:hypothetical protein ACTHGU_07840 [Chitinophagaceae bacterium MMS25-I14]